MNTNSNSGNTSTTSPTTGPEFGSIVELSSRVANRSAGQSASKRQRRHAARRTRMAAAALSLTATATLTSWFASSDKASAATATAMAQSFTGATATNKWGTTQVKITVKGGKITDVTAVKIPDSKPKSQRLSSNAASVLRTEVLSAQSTSVDTVSGATMTSRSYIQSLQSAIDKARAAGALA